MKQTTMKKEMWIIIIPLTVLLLILLTSCKKENTQQQKDFGKAYFRVTQIDKVTSNTTTSETKLVNVVY